MRTKKIFIVLLAACIMLASFPLSASAAIFDAPGSLGHWPGLEGLPAFRGLPNPFEFFFTENDPNGDGVVTDATEWGARREELKELLQRYYLGYKWPTRPQDVQGSATVNAETGAVSGGRVTITNPDSGVERSFTFTVVMPSRAQRLAVWGDENAQVPFVIGLGNIAAITNNLAPHGYASVYYTPTQIYNDVRDGRIESVTRTGIYVDLYPYNSEVYEYASGAFMAWGWGASQILNAMEQPGPNPGQSFGEYLGLDPTRTVVTGHSRNGAGAMIAAAFDERISIAAPSEANSNGVRYRSEGKIFNINFEYYPLADRVYGKHGKLTYGVGNIGDNYTNTSTWFPKANGIFHNNELHAPYEFSDVMALVAPRPYITWIGIDQHWQGNEGNVANVMAATEVYELIGANELEKTNIVLRARESAHAYYNRDFPFLLAIMDREFKQGAADQKLHVQDLFPNGTASNIGFTATNMSYPARDYDTVAGMTSNPFDIDSSFLPWSRPGKYSLYTYQDNFLVGYPTTITAYSDAPDVELYLPGGSVKINASSSNNGVFTFDLTADQAVYGRYELRSAGTAKDNRSVYFAAVSLSDALRHGTTKGDEGEENRVIGFSSRIANTDGDLPLVYVTGEDQPLTMARTFSRMKIEETTLLEYGLTFHDPLFYRLASEPGRWARDNDHTFNVKNLKFVTIPGYTFEISYSDIYAGAGTGSSSTPGQEGAAQFTKPISWKVEKFNNGPAAIWPEWPDTQAEKQSGVINRPESPTPKHTDFKAEITAVEAVRSSSGDATDIAISFSEALRTGEFGFGLNIADLWTTTWSDGGAKVTLSIADADFHATDTEPSLIVYRLMDLDGNLIGGPMTRDFELPAYVTVTGPASVVSGAGATASYTVSVGDAPAFSAVELEFAVNGDYLSSKSFTTAGGFEFLSEGNYDTPIFWRNTGNRWIGKATLINAGGAIGDANILNMVFDVAEGVLGTAEVEIIYAKLSFEGASINAGLKGATASTDFLQYYSPFDLNQDGVIDLNDVTYALQFLLRDINDPDWEDIKAVDLNNNNVIDAGDLSLILANYTIPYYG